MGTKSRERRRKRIERIAQELRGGIEVLAVLDDWKAERLGECSFSVRTFPLHDADKVRDIIGVLHDAGAAAWHASGDRAQHQFLFSSAYFDRVLAAARRLRSQLFAIRVSLRELDAQSAQRARSLRTVSDDMRRLWMPEGPAGAEAAALHLAAGRLLLHLKKLHPAIRKYHLVVDRMAWLKSASGDALVPLGTFGDAACQLEVAAIASKSHPGAQNFLAFLGLVDSESWFFGRYFRGLRFPDNSTVVDRLIRWRGAGNAADQQLFSAEEFAELLRPHLAAGHQRLLKYMSRWASWHRRGLAFNLSQSPDEAAEAARLLSSAAVT